MKQECLLCERSSPDHNLYCQETYCPAEESPTILNYGDWLGNIEIVKPLVALRSAVVYEARCQKKKVLLKVAHPGAANRERLKREAQFLQALQHDRTRSEYLPVWLPPYANTSGADAYGKIVLKDRLLYYCLFDHFGGEPLRAVLAKSAQLWVYHIGWITVHLAYAVAYLQSKDCFHFGLSPDVVLFRTDEATGAPSILLCDLGVASDRAGLSTDWHPAFVPPAYTAPELLDAAAPQPNYATDVYGLGLILYELLIGQPVFPFRLRSDQDVTDAVRQNRRAPMTRGEDVRAAAEIATRAADPDPAARYPDAATLVHELRGAFSEAPEKKRPVLLIATVLAVSIIILVTLLIVVAVWKGWLV